MVQPSAIAQSVLYNASFYEVKNFIASISAGQQTDKAYNDCFCLLFPHRGNICFEHLGYGVNLFSGFLLADKPGYDYRLTPSCGACTVINFSPNFYEQLKEDMSLATAFFFSNRAILSLLLKTNARLDYLHYQLLLKNDNSTLSTDCIVIEMVKAVAAIITNNNIAANTGGKALQSNLAAIERSKEFIHTHFTEDFSLFDIAKHAFISPFHFSRLFKLHTGQTPHQYVLDVKLQHSAMLLQHTKLAVCDVACQSGFANADYFGYAFKKWSGASPLQFRRK